MLAKLMDWLFGPAVHCCPQCDHVLPSHRARYHAGVGVIITMGGMEYHNP